MDVNTILVMISYFIVFRLMMVREILMTLTSVFYKTEAAVMLLISMREWQTDFDFLCTTSRSTARAADLCYF